MRTALPTRPATRLPAIVAALLVLVVACARASAPHDVRLEDLGSVDAFAQRFDAARGKARLVLLLSPT